MGTPKKDAVNHVQAKTNGEAYGRVILTLKNCLLPEEKLSPTPSQIDGLDPDTEMDLRILGCELMQTAGILLKLPQVAMATAQVLFHRFYYSKSFVRQNYEITGMGCLYLASKIEEAPRRIRDVINVYHHIKQVNNQKTIAPMILDQSYINLKYQVIKAERRVLKELGFCVHVKHPHKLIVLYLQVLGLESKQTLMQLAWNYMNDSLRTDVFVRYQPETVACACIYLTARRLKIVMPRIPAWWEIFKVDEKDILDVCVRILRLYARPKPKVELLEKKVQELSKKFEENRQKNKTGFSSNVASGTNTPTSDSVTEKKASPKRRSHSDRSRSRSRSASTSPKHKKSKKHKRSTSRSRSRSRSYEKKYKKSHKNSRRSRSSSPSSKTYKDKKYRSRSRSYERETTFKKLPNDGKYYSDRYKEEKGYDRYYKDDKYRSKDDDKYRKDDDKYRKEKSSSKEDERNKKDDKHKKNDDNYRKDDKYRDENYKNSEKNYDDEYKDDRKLKYKSEDKYSRDVKYVTDKNSKNDKYDDKDRYSSDKYSSKDKHKNLKSDKYNSKDDDYISKDDSYSSKRDKYENDRKRKSKHKSDEDEEDEEEDDVEVLSVKREKKVR